MLARLARTAGAALVAIWIMTGEAAAQAVCGLASTTAGPFVTGGGATATGMSSLACGPLAVATSQSTSIGQSAGLGAAAGNDQNVAVGAAAGAAVAGDNNTALGTGAGLAVFGDNNTASGALAGQFVTGDNNVAIGNAAGSGTGLTTLTVSGSTSIGANSLASGNNSTALGNGSGASGASSMALGDGAQSAQANAIAIGAGVATTRVGQVAIGDTAATYTLAGINSSASKAAQSGDTFVVTSDGSGNLATTTFSITQIADLDTRVTTNTNDIAALDGRVTSLENSFGEIDGRIDKAFEGTAMAIAMTGGIMPADKDYSISVNWGNFEGENAFAGSAFARINENFIINGGIGVGTSHATVGTRAGITYAW